MQYIFILVSNESVTKKTEQNINPYGKILKGKEGFLLCNFAESLSDSMPIVVSYCPSEWEKKSWNKCSQM